jgi:thiol:disulfide interchange protein DsbD
VAVAGQKGIENVVPAVGTGTVMEDALEPSLGASNSLVATPEKAWSQRLNQLQKGLWSIFFIAFLSGFAALLTPCVFDDSMTVSFTKQSKTKRKALAMRLCMGFQLLLFMLEF